MWKTYLEPLRAANPNIRLGSPAPSSNPNGIQWIWDFLGNCNGGCTLDFIALRESHVNHPTKYLCLFLKDYYDVNATDFIQHINEYHNAFQRPIWVTEWACQNFVSQIHNTQLDTLRTNFPLEEQRSSVLV